MDPILERYLAVLFGSEFVKPLQGPPAALREPTLSVAPPPAGPSKEQSAPPYREDGGKRLSDFDRRNARQPPPRRADELKPDLDYEAIEGVREALAAIDAGAPAVMIHGGAGVGKTHLIHYLRVRPGGDRQVVVAPTGIAALNAKGQTIHSVFRLPPRVLDPDRLEENKGRPPHLWLGMNRLVIDEISMVRVDVLDAIDARLRFYRRSPLPFGGVQVVMIGDPLQLPPVVEDQDRELLYALGYRTPFLHSARVWSEVDLHSAELTRVFRQRDPDFIAALNRIRRGEQVEDAVAFLNAACHRRHRPDRTPILLTPTRAAADHHNRAGLAALPGEPTLYRSRIKGKFDVARDRLPAPEVLALKPGAEVMAVKNDVEHRWVNGSRGQVVSLSPDEVVVRFYETGQKHPVGRVAWEKVRQVWNASEQRVESEVVGSYKQIPLIPGWALTIHKAQGLTLEDVRVDLGSGTFASGQLYVALSRATSLDGLSFQRPLRVGDVKTDPQLVEFLDWLEQPESEHDPD